MTILVADNFAAVWPLGPGQQPVACVFAANSGAASFVETVKGCCWYNVESVLCCRKIPGEGGLHTLRISVQQRRNHRSLW